MQRMAPSVFVFILYHISLVCKIATRTMTRDEQPLRTRSSLAILTNKNKAKPYYANCAG